MIPSALAHQRRGMRKGVIPANGLMLRGVVIAVYEPGDPRLAQIRGRLKTFQPSITCDVFIYDPGFTTVLRDVPIVRMSAGLVDNDLWKPRPASQDQVLGLTLATGFATDGTGINLAGAPNPPVPVSKPENMDGDHVIVAFLADDMAQPIIMGAFDHPRNVSTQLVTSPIKYKERRRIRGWTFGMTEGGVFAIDGTLAGAGLVPPTLPPVETPSPLAGAVNLALGAGSAQKVSIGLLVAPSLTQEPVVLGRTFLTDLQTMLTQLNLSLSEIVVAMAAIPGPPPSVATALAATKVAALSALITTSLAAGRPHLASKLETD